MHFADLSPVLKVLVALEISSEQRLSTKAAVKIAGIKERDHEKIQELFGNTCLKVIQGTVTDNRSRRTSVIQICEMTQGSVADAVEEILDD